MQSHEPEQGPPEKAGQAASKTSLGAWGIFGFLGALLLVAVVGSWMAFVAAKMPAISVHGWIAMSIGIFFSLVIGCGLMWLSFYSSRNGFDERADPGRLRLEKDVKKP